jgi:hydrogen peroxide-dependent heme synthase
MSNSRSHAPDAVFPPLVLDGWFMLHQFFRLDPASLHADAGVAGGFEARARALAELVEGWEEPENAETAPEGGWSGFYRVVGGEADYLLLHLRPTLEALGETERAVRRSPAALDLVPAGDYLSVVELGLYAVTHALLEVAAERGIEPGSAEWETLARETLEAEQGKRYVQARLMPLQPVSMPWLCFYPMDKRRNVGQNWYLLPMEERATLMAEHGSTGRRYAGRVSQIISGSVGFDDWEWAVTLFAADPLAFKSLVTEMRYDEVTSIYGEFGTFRVAQRIRAREMAKELLED